MILHFRQSSGLSDMISNYMGQVHWPGRELDEVGLLD